MAKAIVIDLSRLLIACLRPTPRGIERVDHALIAELCADWTGDVFGLIWTPIGGRIVDRTVIQRLLGHVSASWHENDDPESDPAFLCVQRWLQEGGKFGGAPPLGLMRKVNKGIGRAVHSVLNVGVHMGQPLSAIPANALLVVLGHIGLAAPGMASLLNSRRDVKLAVLVHDMISLEAPHFFPVANKAYFQKVFQRALRPETLFLTTTNDMRSVIERHVHRLASGLVHSICPISIASAFHGIAEVPPEEPAATPYFLICGTREPRKNHLLMLNIWREIIQQGAVPRLIVVGDRGWCADMIDATIRRSVTISQHVASIEQLGTPGLRKLMRGARGLLSPSFAEGFGLPVAEALLAGTPVIAADLPVYRETTAGLAHLLHPLDGPAWRAAIEARIALPTGREDRIHMQLTAMTQMTTYPTIDRTLSKV